MLEGCKPVYETLPGWKKPTEGTNRLQDLPPDARKYLARLEALCGTPIAMISTGRDRNSTILDMEKGSATGLERWVRS